SDRLQVELGQGISRTGQETLDAQMQVAQKVFKKDDALYLTAERDVYDDFNIGVKIVFRFK
ncbi:MAG: hypothetical protein M0017_00785, partial [Desulfobacteraceae bacterium]|nr:hypothetical protein [Desulfobacteraceae bacterium]